MKHIRFEKTGRRGWFVGDFPEAAFQTNLAEVCYCKESSGKSAAHYHTVCTETVYIISGKVLCQGKEYSDGDILVFSPGEINDCEYLTETIMIGVKTPAGKNDKVIV